MIAAAATAAVGLLLAASAPQDDTNLSLANWRGSQPRRVEIGASSVRGMHPGATRTIELTVRNPNAFPIRLSSIRGAILATSRPGCRPIATNLEVLRYRGRLPLIIRPRERRDLAGIAVRMPNTVADACQNTRFIIRISGDASKVDR